MGRYVGSREKRGIDRGLRGFCCDVNIVTYYGNVYPFANLIRQALPWYDGATIGMLPGGPLGEYGLAGAAPTYAYANPQEWLSNIPHGSSHFTQIGTNNNLGEAYIPPGNYQATPKAGCYCQVFGTACSSIVNGTSAANPTATFTITDPGEVNDPRWIGVIVTNDSGSTMALMDYCYVGKVSNKAAHDAGTDVGIFDPQWLACMEGAASVRVGDWHGQNSTWDGLLDVTKRVWTESNRLWGSDWAQYCVPYTVCAKMAKVLNAALWLVLPIQQANQGNQRWYYSSDGTTDIISVWTGGGALPGQAVAHGFAADEPVVFYGFNGAAGIGSFKGFKAYTKLVPGQPTQLQIAATPGGAAIDIGTIPHDGNDFGFQIASAGSRADPTAVWTAIFQAVYSVWPGAHVLPEITNENWNAAYHMEYLLYVMPHVWGQSLANGVGHAYSALKAWVIAESIFPSAQVMRMHLLDNQGGAILTYTDPGVRQNGVTFGNQLQYYAQTGYVNPQSAVGGNIYLNWQDLYNAGASTWTDQQWYNQFVITAQGFIGEATYRSTVELPGDGLPNVKLITYESGNDMLAVGGTGNDGRGSLTDAQLSALFASLHTWIKSQSCADFWFWYLKQFEATNCRTNGIWIAGNWANLPAGNFVTAYGVKRAAQLPDTPLIKVIRSWRGLPSW